MSIGKFRQLSPELWLLIDIIFCGYIELFFFCGGVSSLPAALLFYFKVCPPPLDPVNPLYCILIWSFCIIYLSGKLGPGGGAYFEIKNDEYPIVLNFGWK